MSSHQRQFVYRRLFASGQRMHQFEDSFVSPTLSARICGNSVDCKILSTSAFVVFDIHHYAFGSHWRKALVLFSQDGLAVLVFTASIPTGSDVTESMVFAFSRRAQTCALAQHINTAIHEISTTAHSLYCRAPGGSMTYLRLVLHFRCEPRFGRRLWKIDKEFTICSRRQTSRDSALAS